MIVSEKVSISLPIHTVCLPLPLMFGSTRTSNMQSHCVRMCDEPSTQPRTARLNTRFNIPLNLAYNTYVHTTNEGEAKRNEKARFHSLCHKQVLRECEANRAILYGRENETDSLIFSAPLLTFFVRTARVRGVQCEVL